MMLKFYFSLFLVLAVCGCTTVAPKSAPAPKDQLTSIRESLRIYHDCLKQKVEPYLKTKAKPKTIAEAVAKKCEPALNDYKFAVREFYVEGLSPETEGYNKLVLTKPEIHAKRVRTKGESATIARVLEARKAAPR